MIDAKKTYTINAAARALGWNPETARKRLHAMNEHAGGELLRLVSPPGSARPTYIMTGAMLRKLVGFPDEDLGERLDMLEESVTALKRAHDSGTMKRAEPARLARSA